MLNGSKMFFFFREAGLRSRGMGSDFSYSNTSRNQRGIWKVLTTKTTCLLRKGEYYQEQTIRCFSIYRLKREREERRLQQSANPRGTITLSINATDMFMKYYDEYEIL